MFGRMGRQPLAQPWMNVYSLDTKVFSHPSIHSLSKLPHSLGILKKNLLLLTYGNKTDATLFDFTPNFPSEGKIFLKISSSPSKRMGWPSDTSLFLKWFFYSRISYFVWPPKFVLFFHHTMYVGLFIAMMQMRPLFRYIKCVYSMALFYRNYFLDICIQWIRNIY